MVCAALSCVFAFALCETAHAGGVHGIALTSIPEVRTPLVIDGHLSDWPDLHPVVFTPLDPGLAKDQTPAMAQLRSHSYSATVQAAYDQRALYFGIVWTGLPRIAQSGELQLSIQTDRMVHIQIAPSFSGWVPNVLAKMSADSPWRSIGTYGAKSASVHHPDGTTSQEIRIPWTVLTASSQPTTSLALAIDMQWPSLTASFMRQLPTQVRHDNTLLTDCFLTSPKALFTREPSLGNPADWGSLIFSDGPHTNATRFSALRTGATETYVSKVSAPLPVTGSLAGWESSQFQTAAFAPGFLGDRYSAKIGTAYDSNVLYVGMHAKALGGPLNKMAEATKAGYAGGDCLQIRFNDGKQTVNLCAWYDSVNKKAALTEDGQDAKSPSLLAQGAQEAFATDRDGTGYTQVIAIPWKELPPG